MTELTDQDIKQIREEAALWLAAVPKSNQLHPLTTAIFAPLLKYKHWPQGTDTFFFHEVPELALESSNGLWILTWNGSPLPHMNSLEASKWVHQVLGIGASATNPLIARAYALGARTGHWHSTVKE